MKANHQDVVGGAIGRSPLAMVLTDPRLEDNPITYVNRAFETLTLYSRSYAIGRNCRFLQGPDTDPRDVERLREGLRSEREFEVTLTNHRADGSTFRNLLLIAPIHSDDGELTGYFGLQRQVAEDRKAAGSSDEDSMALLKELQHRVKNHLAMIVSMIRVQARREVTPESLRSISRRIEALSVLYDELLTARPGGKDGHEIATGAYLSRIASVVTSIQPHASIRVNVDCEDISLPVDQAARLGLLLSEFLTNSQEHAFEGRSSGLVDIRFVRLGDGTVRLSVEDDGRGMPEASNWPFAAASIETQRDRAERAEGALDTTGRDKEPGVGGSIVAALIESLGAEISVTRPPRGTIVTVDL
ncbi:PAS domain-containing protein [Roseibacterium sp. SDUM158017]|uniref:PAS domain-containing protein n=1 Tax=Roseicyclus salinarum TaxID=3036773 RepID=UPI002414FD7B|nr:PAS domain-containing protein [Roseibacterium sp. SDUM158017]MDG4647690.1 PAS domain-containing protein [Roseibacterium sp. SDUM158017]